MILNKQQKEEMVVDLLNKGYTAKQISKMAHVSFMDIKMIRMKVTGDFDENAEGKSEKETSVSTQAFKLFVQGYSPVSVAIELDLPTQ